MNEPQESRMVIGLADITGFASACQNKTDIDTFNMLNQFYALVGDVVRKAGGTVVKFMGDSALVIFPESEAKQAVTALRELASSSSGVWSDFDRTCTVRIKAHVGSVVSGHMGPDNRFDVIGNALNQLFLMPWKGPDVSDELKSLMEQ
jgi:adenylate cyclase